MKSIDFSTIKDIDKRLAPNEIQALNGVFSRESIQSKIIQIEKHRKTRSRWMILIYIITIIVAAIAIIIGGISETVIWIILGTFFVPQGILYQFFAAKIEVPLKSEVLSNIAPLLYSKLQYSHDDKFSFSDLGILQMKGFLKSFTYIDLAEDSVQFDMEKDGKRFFVNGFELETSEMQGSGKNRKRVTTNHCYLLKIEFPHARIPLKSDVKILTDDSNNQLSNLKWLFLLLPSSIIFFLIYLICNAFGCGSTTIWIGFGVMMIMTLIIGGFMYREDIQKRSSRIKLESIEFEKYFDVYSDDPVASRMIITPAFMDRVVRFIQKTESKYEFLFQSNIMYVKRLISGQYLEAGTKKDMTKNLEGYVQFYIDMREIMQFAYDMNLMYLSKTDVDFVDANPEYTPKNTPLSGGNIGITQKNMIRGRNKWVLGIFQKFLGNRFNR